jgi:hypothetical protein
MAASLVETLGGTEVDAMAELSVAGLVGSRGVLLEEHLVAKSVAQKEG